MRRAEDYQTRPGRRRSLLARFSPWPSLAFYPPVVWVVLLSRVRVGLGRYGSSGLVRASWGIVDAMERVGMHLRIEGLHHVREFPGPAVFVANHMSTLETFVLPAIVEPLKPVTFVVKESLLRYPVFGPILGSLDPIPVGRENPREDLTTVLRQGAERLARGTSIIVFPQTTRTTVFDPERFNSIGAKLAARAQVPLVPVALRTDAWGTGRRAKDFGPIDPALPVRFRFGTPIPPEGKGNRAHQESCRFIREALAEWTGGVSPAETSTGTDGAAPP